MAVGAQDYIFTHFKTAHVDHVLPTAPCAVSDSVQPFVFDHSAWMVYTCTDGRQIARRFIHPADHVRETVSVQTAGKPLAVYQADPPPTYDPDPSGGQAAHCKQYGLVVGITGGCVTSNHPWRDDD